MARDQRETASHVSTGLYELSAEYGVALRQVSEIVMSNPRLGHNIYTAEKRAEREYHAETIVAEWYDSYPPEDRADVDFGVLAEIVTAATDTIRTNSA